MRILVLTTDAFGGYGGIAQYNRDLLTALCEMPGVSEVVAVPRTLPFPPGRIPEKLKYYAQGAGSKVRYIIASLQAMRGNFDLLICGHVHILTLATLINLRLRAPMVLVTYGVDVWQQPASPFARFLIRKQRQIWAISKFTRDKMRNWSGLSKERFRILPNAINLDKYGLGEKDPSLVARYGLGGKRVIMTLGRLSTVERWKGIDEVLNVMPRLIQKEPSLMLMVVGDGDDRSRLEKKASELELTKHVTFTGYVPEYEKASYLRLADAVVMPTRAEGFGFVFLEALACGVPVVASRIDGSQEALMGGRIGRLVNPDDAGELEAAALGALGDGRRVPDELAYFAFEKFRMRLWESVREATKRKY